MLKIAPDRLKRLIALPLALVTWEANGETVPIDYELPNTFLGGAFVDAIGESSNEGFIRYRGTLSYQLEVNNDTGVVLGGTLSPSRVDGSNLTQNVQAGGTTILTGRRRNIEGITSSIGVFETVPFDEENGRSFAFRSDFTSTLDIGTATTEARIGDFPSMTRDFDVEPSDFTLRPLEFAPTLISGDSFSRTWSIETTHRLATDYAVPIDDFSDAFFFQDIDFTVSEMVTLETSYSQWLTTEGLPRLPFDSIDPASGLPNAAFFALRLPRSTQIPLAPSPDNPRTWLLTLPEEGTLAPITVEGSTDLSSDSWEPIANNSISTRTSTIAAGETGEVEIRGSEFAEKQFFRLRFEQFSNAP